MNKNQSMVALQNALANPALFAVLESAFPELKQELVVAAAADTTAACLPAEPSAFEVLVADAVVKSFSTEKVALIIEEKSARAVNAHIEEVDFADEAESALRDACDNLDLSDAAADAVSEAIEGGSRQVERALTSAVEDAVSNVDIESVVRDAVNDMDLEPMVKDAVDQYIASVMDEQVASKVIEAAIAKAVAKQWEAFTKQSFKLVPETAECICGGQLIPELEVSSTPATQQVEERVQE